MLWHGLSLNQESCALADITFTVQFSPLAYSVLAGQFAQIDQICNCSSCNCLVWTIGCAKCLSHLVTCCAARLGLMAREDDGACDGARVAQHGAAQQQRRGR